MEMEKRWGIGGNEFGRNEGMKSEKRINQRVEGGEMSW
jgi:hypothetical protein